MGSFLLFRRWGILIFGDIEDDPVPAVFADQGPVDGEQNLLPRAQFMTAMRAGIVDPASLRISLACCLRCFRPKSYSGFRMMPLF